MRNHIKSIIGIMLILLSIGGLFFWEWKGRDVIYTEQVLVAKEEIRKGTIVDSNMFEVKGVQKSNLLENAIPPENLGLIQGKEASQLIPKNNQIIMEYFRNSEFYLDQNESVFVVNPEWISMRSSALRRGDVVDIYGSNGFGLLGTYQIAYVKDKTEREVRTVVREKIVTDFHDGILDRTDSSAVIDHVEIITTFAEYEKLFNCIHGFEGTTPAALIIVQRGDQIDS